MGKADDRLGLYGHGEAMVVYNDSLERNYEKRRRTAEPAEQHRELLPTRQNDGSLKKQRVKLTKREIEKKKKQDEARANGESGKKGKGKKGSGGGDNDDDEAEPVAASSNGPSEKALRAIAKQEANAALTVEEKKVEVARLAQRLLEAPHKNVKLLRQLHDFACRDRSAMVQRLALLSMVAVLRDVLPAYRIRLPTDKELTMQVSRDIHELREYEKTLLRAYDDCLGTLKKWINSYKYGEAQCAAAVRGACALLVKGRDFNSREVLVELVVPVCNWGAGFEAQRDAACAALVELFAEDEKGDCTLLAVRAMANVFKEKSFNVRPELLRCWLQLKLDAAVAVGGNADGGAAGAGKRAKKRKRMLDPVAKELAQAAGERGDKGLMQGQILELVFVSYARLIKKAPQSPLMPLVLKGVAKFAHQVNVSLLLDLVANLRLMLRQDSAMSTEVALHCVHATMRVLSGHGQALSVDQKDLQLRLFQVIIPPLPLSAHCLSSLPSSLRSPLSSHLCSPLSPLSSPLSTLHSLLSPLISALSSALSSPRSRRSTSPTPSSTTRRRSRRRSTASSTSATTARRCSPRARPPSCAGCCRWHSPRRTATRWRCSAPSAASSSRAPASARCSPPTRASASTRPPRSSTRTPTRRTRCSRRRGTYRMVKVAVLVRP